MSDGARIAVDLDLPEQVLTESVPVLLRSTRYWRAVAWTDPSPPPELDRYGDLTQTMLSLGVAVVTVDARGSGASFGHRDMELSPREQADMAEVVAHIAAQPWCSGRIAGWGISYDADTAELTAASGHPSLVGYASLFGGWDHYTDTARPGGLLNVGFTSAWSDRVKRLDQNDPCALSSTIECEVQRAAQRGVAPVRGEENALSAAIDQHAGNMDFAAAAERARFADEAMGQSGITLVDVSPRAAVARLNTANVPSYVAASWMDGATALAALQRFADIDAPQSVSIGAWSHGAFAEADPFATEETPGQPPIVGLVGEMFGVLLPLLSGDAASGSRIRYQTLNGGGWQTTETWPPEGLVATQFYLGTEALRSTPPTAGAVTYDVDFTATTGLASRWRTAVDGEVLVHYPDRAAEDAKLVTFTSEPLDAAMEITGIPVVDLWVSTNRREAAFFAYLEVVEEDGTVRYVTEGQLAAVHRKTTTVGIDEVRPVVRSFAQVDAADMPLGEPQRIQLALLPTSVLVRAGQRVRISLAGADAHNFERVPSEGEVEWQVLVGGQRASTVSLPMKAR